MKLKNNQVLAYLGLFFLVLANLFFFQNCSPNKSNVENLSSTTGLVATASVRTDGQCSRTVNNCSAGSFLNVADSATQSLWKCNGTGGGVSVLCSSSFSTTPVDGQCSPTTINGCIQGSMNDLADNSTTNIWRCEGFNGGAGADCSLPRTSSQVAANGQCGRAKDSCNVGSFVDVADTPTQNQWICRGILGAADANCSATIISASTGGALCGAAVNTCAASSTFSDQADSTTINYWRCTDSSGFYNNCYKALSSCALTVRPVTHINETYTYNISMSNGTLPAQVKLKLFSSRSNPDGTGTANDADGGDNYTSTVSTPVSITATNNGRTQAGIYNRYYAVIDPTTNATLCTTNTVSHVLTPACTLSVSATSTTTSGTVTFSAVTPSLGELQLRKPAFNIAWYGTKTVDGQTTNDEQGRLMSASSFPLTLATTAIGSYKRYYVATDINNVEVCRSNEVAYSVDAPPPPPPTPAPTPAPVPAPPPTPVAKDCSFNNQTVNHASKVLAYTQSRVNYGSTCDSVQVYRNCDDGVLDNPSATFATCTPDTTVQALSCRAVAGTANVGGYEAHCAANEAMQSISIFSPKYLQGVATMMCCQMNVDLEETENPKYSNKGIGSDETEHVAVCGPNELMSGYSVVTDQSRNNYWDGNWTVFCRATSKQLNTNSVVLGNASDNGITSHRSDNVFHTTTCNGQFLTGLGLWANDRLDNISREWCSSLPGLSIIPTPSPNPGTGGGGGGGGGINDNTNLF